MLKIEDRTATGVRGQRVEELRPVAQPEGGPSQLVLVRLPLQGPPAEAPTE